MAEWETELHDEWAYFCVRVEGWNSQKKAKDLKFGRYWLKLKSEEEAI